MERREQEIAQLTKDWAENPRWAGIQRPYRAEDRSEERRVGKECRL